MKIPRFYRWGGGGKINDAWSFGYLTGQDNDLVCVEPNIYDKIQTEIALSPVCSTRLLAISAFWVKKYLLRVDQNLGMSRRLRDGNPSKESDNLKRIPCEDH